MKTSGIAWRVGLFVAIGLLVLAGLILQFGKIRERFQSYRHVQVTYQRLAQVAPGANVTMSGVSIGKVGRISLAPDGRSVNVMLDIVPSYNFRKDARIVVRQAGLLGDMYLEVIAQGETAPLVTEGDVLRGEDPPPDFSELLSQGAQIIRKADSAVGAIEHVARTLDEKILNEQTAAKLGDALRNIEQMSTNLVVATRALQEMVVTGRPRVDATLNSVQQIASNLTVVVSRADGLIKNTDRLVTENRKEIQAAIANMGDSTAKISAMIGALRNGQGTAGKLLTDSSLHDELLRLISNWRRFGILYKEGGKAPPAGSDQNYIFGGTPKK